MAERMTSAGARRNPVRLERPGTPAAGALGGDRRGWETVAPRLWARIEPLSGRQLLEARTVHNEATHKVTVPHGGPGGVLGTTPGGNGYGITPGMRFVHRGRGLVIVHAGATLEDRREVVCTCVERPVLPEGAA